MKTKGWLYFPLLGGILFLYSAFQPRDGLIGHDYYHDFPRFYIGALHFWRNFLAIPHFTPYLCGGIPLFADPQSSYYSLPQFLTFFMEPLTASTITILLFYILGYFGSLKLLREAFHCSTEVAHLGALMFLFNGFAFAHLFVGHLTHHSYLLAPWAILLLSRGRPRDAIPLTLLLTYTFYSGGLHVLVVLATVFLLLLPNLLQKNLDGRRLRRFFLFLCLTGVLFIFTTSGKLVASYSYSKNFLERGIDASSESPLWIVLRYFWFDPFSDHPSIPFGQALFGAWEYVGFFTRLAIPSILGFCYFAFISLRQRKFTTTIVGSLFIVPMVIFLACGLAWNEYLPFFKGYHNPIKLLGAFIPILVILTSLALNYLVEKFGISQLRPQTRGLVFGLCATLLFLEFGLNANFFIANKIGLTFPFAPQVYQAIRTNPRPAVASVIDRVGADFLTPVYGVSNLRCYEPVFGYRWEQMKSTAIPGKTAIIRDGTFNLNHPGCLVYPEFYHCKAWDRIPLAERKNFQKFVEGDSTAWSVPKWQSYLIYFNFLNIGALIGLFIGCSIRIRMLK